MQPPSVLMRQGWPFLSLTTVPSALRWRYFGGDSLFPLLFSFPLFFCTFWGDWSAGFVCTHADQHGVPSVEDCPAHRVPVNPNHRLRARPRRDRELRLSVRQAPRTWNFFPLWGKEEGSVGPRTKPLLLRQSLLSRGSEMNLGIPTRFRSLRCRTWRE